MTRDNARPLRMLTIGSVLAVLFTTLLVTVVVVWATAQSDEAARSRELQVVARALTKSIEKIPYDQESVANWDDAVTNVRIAFNENWVHENLGAWMYDYHKHDRVYILDTGNRPLYTMADGQHVPVSTALPSAEMHSLVEALRHQIADGALGRYARREERIPRAVDLVLVEGRPAVVSVMPLLPHTAHVRQVEGEECLSMSVRFLDKSFLSDLADAYLLENVRFSRDGEKTAGEQSHPLINRAGTTIGYFVWSTRSPGAEIMSRVLPVLVAGLFVVSAAIAFLIRSLRRTYTELMTSEAQAKHLAFHDPLTGLPNRAYFNARLDAALAGPCAGCGRLALMFLDLDRFKQVNDTLGHAAGDALMRDLAKRLAGTLSPGDVLARMGGDEFAVIKCNVRDEAEVEAFCRAIISAASEPFDLHGTQATIGISIGVAMSPEAGIDRKELARKADIALYRAKNAGRQCYVFFTEDMREALEERWQLEAELRNALACSRELEVVYQPIFEASSRNLHGVEALVRWNHPRLGSVPPADFLSLAEECGLIGELGAWVLRQGCRAAAAWPSVTVSVNVSPLEIQEADFTARVLAVLNETGIEPKRLQIEISESTLPNSSFGLGQTLSTLRESGVKVALDHFGAGCASLSSLIKRQVDCIKIDGAFVRQLGDTPEAVSTVQSIITMAHAVGVTVTAEGVETREQNELLTLAGCDYLEGSILSEPVSALGVSELIAAARESASRRDTKAA